MKRNLFLLVILVLLTGLTIFPGCGGGGNKSDSNPEPTPIVAPSAPEAPELVVADRQISASWKAVNGAIIYQVYYSTKDDNSTGTLAAAPTEPKCIINGLDNDVTYYVWVKAQNSAGTSDFSPGSSAKPVAPVVPPSPPIIVNVISEGKQLTVSWPAVFGATSYEVWYSSTNDSNTASKYNEVTDTSCTITGLTSGTTYYIWVKAKNSAGISGFSSPGNATVANSGSIKGLVNSDSRFSVSLIETNQTSYFNMSDYYSFDSLSPGTYHLKFERNGYKSIIKEIQLNTDEQKNIDTLSFNDLLPTGNGFYKKVVNLSVCDTQYSTAHAEIVTFISTKTISINYSISNWLFITSGCAIFGYPAKVYDGWIALITPTSSYSPVFFVAVPYKSSRSSSTSVTLSPGSYYFFRTTFKNYSNTGSISGDIEYSYPVDNDAPSIVLSKTWWNSSSPTTVNINVTDSISGVKSVSYALTNSLSIPSASYFTNIPSNTAVQILEKGIWYLHVKASDNDLNEYCKTEGPFIIQ